MSEPPYRKRIRLDRERYSDPGTVWFATADTRDRRPISADPGMARLAVDVLIERCANQGGTLLLYCVMPDHLHALIQIEDGDLIAIMGAVKSLLANRWNSLGNDGKLWQRSFHDSGIRSPENLDEQITYILENPVKAGLVSDWSDFPWLGGRLLSDQ